MDSIRELNFKLVGKINHDGRPAYLLNLKKKIQGASFAGYTIIDQKTGFGLLYKQQHKMGGEDQPGTFLLYTTDADDEGGG